SASQGSSFAFLETSSCCANSSGDNARLRSPFVSGTNRAVTFDYHMYGGNIGTLHLDVQVSGGSWQTSVRSQSGNQGNSWQSASVDLSSFSGDLRVRFRAVAAGGWQGDIAIDNLSLTTGSGGGGGFGPAPTNLTATVDGSAIDLSWSDNSTGEDSFRIERSSGGAFSEVGSVGTGVSTYTDNGVSTGVTYTYRVRAEDQGVFSDYSNTASATVPGGGGGNLAFLQPINGDKLLFIGQDLLSVSEYISQCAGCPTPGGTATYVNLAGVLTGNFYGALGYTEAKQPFGVDVDWGGGPLNAYSNAIGFPNSAVQIGLYLVDQIDQINSGQLDNQIGHMADYFKAFPNTAFYLRVGYEFDGAWNAYSGPTFITAYRRIVDILRQNGVSNVAYVWQSSTSPIDDIIDGGREPLSAYYPGDNYVDWFGMSWFLRPDEQATVGATISTQRWLADELVNLARSANKPVMICEAAPQGYDIGQGSNSNISTVWDGASAANTQSKSGSQIWSEWFQPFFDYIYANDDVIKGVTLIDADWDSQGLWDAPYEQGYWGDSRI
ncbi:MAG TPA: hypothetical protein DCP28_26940, partial [Cytophagales bacterium]|nr:hypothetical protein [Cytophagales bacterium]